MKLKGVEFDFPAISKVSFEKIFESLELVVQEGGFISSIAKDVLEQLEPYPILREGFDGLEVFEEYADQIQLLARTLFPEVLLTNEIKGVCAPFQFESFYNSTRFQKIIDNAGGEFKFDMSSFDDHILYVIGCVTILNKHYGYNANFHRPFIMEIPDKDGHIRYYRMAFNADLIDIVPTEKAIPITDEDYYDLIDQFDNLDLWKEKFPPDSYIMKGIGIINLFDVTTDQSLSQISSNLLVKSPDLMDKMKGNIKSLFDIHDIEIGFVVFDQDQNSFVSVDHDNVVSLMLGANEVKSCDSMVCEYTYDKLVKENVPFAISDTEKYYERSGATIGKTLHKKGIQSYVLAPLIHEGNFMGFLELGSKQKHVLNSLSISKLVDLLPILSMAISRFDEESKNRIEAIIQEECTTIHSSVKWKFEAEATKYLKESESGSNVQPTFNDIIFKEVYPLYGQIDIKGSSTQRNNAVVIDLKHQLNEVKVVLSRAFQLKHLPTFEELIFRIDSFLDELSDELMAGSEHKILGFLRSEIYPVFDHLKTLDKGLAEMIEHYKSLLNNDMDIIYDARRDFDESVTKLNHTLASFIDEKQVEAQDMFPHYFERYKTDGVEYNMYIGQSITDKAKFDPLYLTNLRLWQLIVTCDMENVYHNLQKELKIPLEVASLILAYNTPLSIHFRMDEKRFDVEGAYNARYEIVKKRVDKAHIKGTDERITQPGKIVVIYTTRQDEQEYRKHFRFLASKGYIVEDSIENLELENLQGITGLKALRVEVNYDLLENRESFTYEQLINEITHD